MTLRDARPGGGIEWSRCVSLTRRHGARPIFFQRQNQPLPRWNCPLRLKAETQDAMVDLTDSLSSYVQFLFALCFYTVTPFFCPSCWLQHMMPWHAVERHRMWERNPLPLPFFSYHCASTSSQLLICNSMKTGTLGFSKQEGHILTLYRCSPRQQARDTWSKIGIG